MRRTIILLLLFLSILASYHIYRSDIAHREEVHIDTFYQVRIDTFVERTPILVRERKVRELVVYGQRQIKADSTAENTNDSIILPITQKMYHKDSLYTAWVSGYMPQLDSISVFCPQKIITITKTEKTKRWNVGLIGGYGVGLKHGKLEPFVGVGVSWNL